MTQSFLYLKSHSKATDEEGGSQIRTSDEFQNLRKAELAKQIKWSFSQMERIPLKSLCSGLLSHLKRDKYHKMLRKMQDTYKRQFDIAKFMKQERLQTYVLLTSLNPR